MYSCMFKRVNPKKCVTVGGHLDKLFPVRLLKIPATKKGFCIQTLKVDPGVLLSQLNKPLLQYPEGILIERVFCTLLCVAKQFILNYTYTCTAVQYEI